MELCTVERWGYEAQARRGRSRAGGLTFNDPEAMPDLGFTSAPAYTPSGPTLPAFYHHGVQYSPSDVDNSPYRTVLIHDVPVSTTAFELTEGIYAGPILSCQLLGTDRMLGHRTARLVFISGVDATNFFQQATDPNTGLIFGGERPRVEIVETPTFPTGARLSGLIRAGASSNIVLIGVSTSAPINLIKDYLLRGRDATHVDSIHRCTRLPNGRIIVRCDSIDLALWISEKVRVETYGYVKVEFTFF